MTNKGNFFDPQNWNAPHTRMVFVQALNIEIITETFRILTLKTLEYENHNQLGIIKYGLTPGICHNFGIDNA